MASIFTKILKGEIPGQILYQDELCAAIVDIQPQAPKHFLIFPKKEIRSIATAAVEDKAILGHLLFVAGQIAREQGFSEDGFRLTINTGRLGGQTVDHLHVHLLAGRQMEWPPG
jgi:histidine triad (HIT) family protein